MRVPQRSSQLLAREVRRVLVSRLRSRYLLESRRNLGGISSISARNEAAMGANVLSIGQ